MPRARSVSGDLWRDLYLLFAGPAIFVLSHLGARAGGLVCLGSPG